MRHGEMPHITRTLENVPEDSYALCDTISLRVCFQSSRSPASPTLRRACHSVRLFPSGPLLANENGPSPAASRIPIIRCHPTQGLQPCFLLLVNKNKCRSADLVQMIAHQACSPRTLAHVDGFHCDVDLVASPNPNMRPEHHALRRCESAAPVLLPQTATNSRSVARSPNST